MTDSATIGVDCDSIDAAARRIDGHVRKTPTIEVEAGAFGVDAVVVLKLESLQHTGSFKPRGAFNRLLGQPRAPDGVIAASGGNHGVAVAYVARELGVTAEIFVPDIIAPAKLARLRDYGAHVVVGGSGYADALAASERHAATSASLVVHAFNQPDVVAGQGTLARELERQAPDLDTVLVAVGGGGLIGGIAAWYGKRVRVIGVEPRTCAALHAAVLAGEPVDVDTGGIAADALGARRIGALGYALAREHGVVGVLVDDASIRDAQRLLWSRLRVFAEPGGATALAALTSGAYEPQRGERIGVVVCGANGDVGAIA